MSDFTPRSGQCMCGAITYNGDVANTFGACHCKMCQRWASGMFMGIHVLNMKVKTGADQIATYKSSDWAERAFCKTCGSNLYYKMDEVEGVSVGIGTLDDLEGLTFVRQFFVDQKSEQIVLASKTGTTMTSADMHAKYGVE